MSVSSLKNLAVCDLVGGETSEAKCENKSRRLNSIVNGITLAKSRKLWISILGGGGFGFLAIFLGAIGSSTENTNTETFQAISSRIDGDLRYC
jgi:hypothetical protein